MNTGLILKVLADSSSGKQPLWKIENFGDAALFSLICIVLVFVVLIVIALVIALMNKIPGLEDKPHATMKDGTELDDDAMAALFVATMEFRKTKKQDCKVVSVELLEDEKVEKKKAKEEAKAKEKAEKKGE